MYGRILRRDMTIEEYHYARQPLMKYDSSYLYTNYNRYSNIHINIVHVHIHNSYTK